MKSSTWRAVAIGLGIALILALVILAVSLDGGADDRSGTSATSEVLLQAEADAEKAARAAAIRLTTYDYTTLDTDFNWVVTAGTRNFQDQYAEVSAEIRKVALELKVQAEGSVDQAAATAQDADHVTVLLFVDQALTSDASTDRQLATPRVSMAMVREGDDWLVDSVSVRGLTGS